MREREREKDREGGGTECCFPAWPLGGADVTPVLT